MPRPSKHPGVKIESRVRDAGNVDWYGRWKDPVTGKWRQTNLRRAGCTDDRQRRRWAEKKSLQLAREQTQLAPGMGDPLPIKDAVALYLDHSKATKRVSTYKCARLAAEKLLLWCERNRIRKTTDLTQQQLSRFRASLELDHTPVTTNSYLRWVKAGINWLHELGHFPQLSSDRIRLGLRRVEEPRKAVQWLGRDDLRRLIMACKKRDADFYELTRQEKAGIGEKGSTPRHEPCLAFVLFALLSGVRVGEAVSLRWDQVHLLAHEGEIRLDEQTKTKRARTIDLGVSAALFQVLADLSTLREKGEERVFPAWTLYAAKQLVSRKGLAKHGAPTWTWKLLRSTCATYLTNAPGIFGAASAYRSARQLGHSVSVAENHYLGVVRGIPHGAKTLEVAMGIEDLL